MYYESTVTYTRPSTSVPFFEFTTDFINYVDETYGSMKQPISITESADGLQQVRVTVWLTYSGVQQFINDQLVISNFSLRDQYNAANGITAQSTFGPVEESLYTF